MIVVFQKMSECGRMQGRTRRRLDVQGSFTRVQVAAASACFTFVNASVSKTSIQHLVRWVIKSDLFDQETGKTLGSILDTVISPKLIPPDERGCIQSTKDEIGPYDLHGFFFYYITRFGLKPSNVAYLANSAWRSRETGTRPAHFPETKKREFDLPTVKGWLKVFLFRFFAVSQFNRSASPNGPKVTSGESLSPRGDWPAPWGRKRERD